MGGNRKSANWRRKANKLHIALLACMFVLAGFYLFQASSIASDRFELESAKLRIDQIRDINNALEIEASEYASLRNLESLSSGLALEEVKYVSYIEVKSAFVFVLNN